MSIVKSLPANFDIEEIRLFAEKLYGIKASVKPMVSDIGQNFRLTHKSGNEYVFKIANPAERKEMLEAQNQAMEFVTKNCANIRCPQIIKTISGDQITTVASVKRNTYLARMLDYIPGKFLADVQLQTPQLLYKFGSVLGAMDKALSDFYHPAANRYWHWDLKNASDLIHYTDFITDRNNRRLVEYFLLQFDTEVLPQLKGFRESVIHNDPNDHNILVNQSAKGEYKISGIIDFGDMVYSYIICELAIACAYMMIGKENPVEAVLPVIKGYHNQNPLTDNELYVLYYLSCARLLSSVTIAAYQKQIQKNNDYLSISEQPAAITLNRLIAINPIKALQLFRETCGLTGKISTGMSAEDIFQKRSRLIGKSLTTSFKKPLKITRAAMQYLFDETGKTYLDCVNNVSHVGHCHPHVVRSAQKQMAILNTNTRYLYDSIVEYASRLTNLFPNPLNVCYFVNSGSEANELAVRLAQTYTNKNDFIVIDNAYHGNTLSVVDLSPYKFDGPGGKGSKPNIHKVNMPDLFHGPYKANDRDAGKKYAKYVEIAIEQMIKNDKHPAGFFCESLLGCGGQIVLPQNYLTESFRLVRNAGGLCIADEVQVGFGRMGSSFWGFETQNVIPDIVTLGKPIGNGHPLGAVITTREIADAFDNGMEYFNTFGGNPVSCAVGLAVLDVIEDEKLQENALKVGENFKQGLGQLKTKHDIIGDVRGLGLFLGIELVTNRDTLAPAAKQATYIVERMKELGIQLSIDGPLHNVLKIKPPMVFTEENADLVVSSLEKILKEEGLHKI
ncbi:aminotransferase class III-fold pyridoxal phosphate-dependent enzyme [Calditrichota bacterium]